MGVKNYNNCMIKTVEEIAQMVHGMSFSDLPKHIQEFVEAVAAEKCSHILADNALHIWRK